GRRADTGRRDRRRYYGVGGGRLQGRHQRRRHEEIRSDPGDREGWSPNGARRFRSVLRNVAVQGEAGDRHRGLSGQGDLVGGEDRGQMNERRWRWVWRPDLGEGAEEFGFRATDRGHEAHGEVNATLEGKPLRASYVVETDAAWR